MTNPTGWITHWVGSPNMPAVPSLAFTLALMRSLQTAAFAGLHGDHYVDFEYNFAIDPLGRIMEGRGWAVQSGANGTTDTNEHKWSVVYLAGPGVPLTAAAKQAFLWLTQEGARRSAAVADVTPHDHVPNDSTGCPGPELTDFSAVLNAQLRTPVAPPAPKVTPMFSPPLQLISFLANTQGGTGAWGLGPDGGVYGLGAPLPKAPFGVNGQSWFVGKPAAIVAPNATERAAGKWYVVLNDQAARYAFPV